MSWRNEEGHFDRLVSFLQSANVECWREVVPDQCQGWDKPYRADLIMDIPGYGLVGVEGKHINTMGSGGVVAKAYKQIMSKYFDKTYFKGQKIKQWCLFLPTNRSSLDSERITIFVRGFLNVFGLGLLLFKEYHTMSVVTINSLTPRSIAIKKEGISFGSLIDGNSEPIKKE